MRIRVLAGFFLLTLVAAGQLIHAADAWVEVKSEHFRVVSNAPARQAVALAPGTLVNHVLLARVLVRAKHPEEAMRIAKGAEALARTDSDRRQVQSLIAEIQRSGG